MTRARLRETDEKGRFTVQERAVVELTPEQILSMYALGLNHRIGIDLRDFVNEHAPTGEPKRLVEEFSNKICDQISQVISKHIPDDGTTIEVSTTDGHLVYKFKPGQKYEE